MNARQLFQVNFPEDQPALKKLLEQKFASFNPIVDSDENHVVVDFNLDGLSTFELHRLKRYVQAAKTYCKKSGYYNLHELNKIRPKRGSALEGGWQTHVPKKNGKTDFLWNHDAVKFPEAIAKISAPQSGKRKQLDQSKGHAATGITVFQFDTGYSNHPDLASYPGYVTPDHADGALCKSFDSNVPFPHDQLLYHFLANKGFQRPGHGTATAFTMIGKEGLPSSQWPVVPAGFQKLKASYTTPLTKGLFPYVRFVPLKATETVTMGGGVFAPLPGTGRPKNLIAAIDHVLKNKGHVVTMSLGGSGFGAQVKKAFKKAYEAGVICVCAAGNSKAADRTMGVIQPAEWVTTIGVAGVEPNMSGGKFKLRPWSQSCDGPRTDISAPAKFIYTALALDPKRIEDPQLRASFSEGHTYKFGGATSQATVHVSSAAALWRFYYDDMLKDPMYQKDKWKIVEAFRCALYASRNVPEWWNKSSTEIKRDYKGILDVEKLLNPHYAPDSDLVKRYLAAVNTQQKTGTWYRLKPGKHKPFMAYSKVINRKK